MSLYPVAILAGGLATRLRPITEKIPKALVEIHGEPFILRQLRLLRQKGIERVVICAWYKGEMIRDVVGDGHFLRMQVDYSFDGDRPLGTAGAIRKALPKLGARFFILYGDSYLPINYSDVQIAFEKSGLAGLMTVYHNQGRYDRCNILFQDGIITCYDKNSPTTNMQHIDYGLSAFSRDVFDVLPVGENIDLSTIFQALLKQKQLAGYETGERFYEIGSFSGLEELRLLFKEGKIE